MKPTPIHDWVVFNPKKEEVKTEGGFVLNKDNEGDLRFGWGVVEMAAEMTGLKKGDEVMYDKAHAHEMMINGERMMLIQYRNIALVP